MARWRQQHRPARRKRAWSFRADEAVPREGSSSAQGRRFEHSVAARLSEFGWEVTLTPGSGDFGCDVIAVCGSEKLVVQCKNWSGPVGYDAVKEAYAARGFHSATHAAVIVSGGFTNAAKAGAARLDVHLLPLDRLTAGSQLDRSIQGERIRRQRARQHAEGEEEQRLAALRALHDEWVIYDAAMQAYPAQRGREAVTLGATLLATISGLWVAIVILEPNPLGFAVLGLIAIWIIGAGVAAFRARKPPKAPLDPRPAQERGGAYSERRAVPCWHCGTLLNLPRGRRGSVTCSTCDRRGEYAT